MVRKIHTQSLKDFILDFGLNSEKLISFNSSIEFISPITRFASQVNVQVVRLENIERDVIYLSGITNTNNRLPIPDMYPLSDNMVSYQKNESLILKGNDSVYGDYTLEIKVAPAIPD